MYSRNSSSIYGIETHTHTKQILPIRPVLFCSALCSFLLQQHFQTKSANQSSFYIQNPMIPRRYYLTCLLIFLLVLSTFSFSHSQPHWSSKKKRLREKVRNMYVNSITIFHNRFHTFQYSIR